MTYLGIVLVLKRMVILFFTKFISSFYISMYKLLLLSIYVIRNILVLNLNYIYFNIVSKYPKSFLEMLTSIQNFRAQDYNNMNSISNRKSF